MSKVVIIGGGAAGMFASIFAARNGNEVHLFEKNEKAAGAYLRQRPFCTIFKENSFRA